MFIFYAPQYRSTTLSGVLQFDANDIALWSRKAASPSALENESVLPDGTRINLLTIFEKGQPKLRMRLINCGFVVMKFMIVVLETDPNRDSTVEFIDLPTYNSISPNSPNLVLTADREIRLEKSGEDLTNLQADVDFFLGSSVASTKVVNQLNNRFIKIFDKTTKKKQDYVLEFSIGSPVGVTTPLVAFAALSKARATLFNISSSTSLDFRFSELVSVFNRSLKGGIFDSTSSEAKLNELKKKNKKLTDLIGASNRYLDELKKNLSDYNNFKA